MSLWVIDFEASGLTKNSYPIEVGITNGNLKYSDLLKPMGHWTYWDAESELIHGINRDFLKRAGVEPLVVANRLNEQLCSEIVYCDCIHWDNFWLKAMFSDNGVTPKFQLCDIQDLIKTGKQWRYYMKKKEELEKLPIYQIHRALDDAMIIQHSLSYALSME